MSKLPVHKSRMVFQRPNRKLKMFCNARKHTNRNKHRFPFTSPFLNKLSRLFIFSLKSSFHTRLFELSVDRQAKRGHKKWKVNECVGVDTWISLFFSNRFKLAVI